MLVGPHPHSLPSLTLRILRRTLVRSVRGSLGARPPAALDLSFARSRAQGCCSLALPTCPFRPSYLSCPSCPSCRYSSASPTTSRIVNQPRLPLIHFAATR